QQVMAFVSSLWLRGGGHRRIAGDDTGVVWGALAVGDVWDRPGFNIDVLRPGNGHQDHNRRRTDHLLPPRNSRDGGGGVLVMALAPAGFALSRRDYLVCRRFPGLWSRRMPDGRLLPRAASSLRRLLPQRARRRRIHALFCRREAISSSGGGIALGSLRR